MRSFKKGTKVTKMLHTAFEHFKKGEKYQKPLYNFLVTFVPFLNDVIRNLLHGNISNISTNSFKYS